MARQVLTCDFCGRKGARIRRATRSYGRGQSEFLIRNIPTVSCTHCGETYLTAQTLRELERIKADHHRVTVKRRIAVANFPRARRAS
ncbi:MAG TPA: type II toxin-antitoxin system MqsA family antitoxin [Planctomycetota bacterium]|nr:type II toxin-antitoxin system MqsA family antitoxin [Planctomycetota bacterium]